MSKEISFFKGYLDSLESYSNNIEKFKAYKKDKRIKLNEKKLLEAHLLIRANKNEDALDLIQNLCFSNDFFIAQQNLVMGLALNNLGKCSEAIVCFSNSIKSYLKIQETDLIIYPLTNIIFAYENISQFHLAKDYLHLLKQVKTQRPIMSFHKLRCLSSEQFYMHNLNEALELIKEAISSLPEDSKHYKSFVIIDQFNIYLQLEDFKSCESLLKKSLKYRVFKNSDNSKYIKCLLENYMHDTPIYAYENDFHKDSLLAKQIMVIKSLSFGELEEAKQYWSELSRLYPQIYQDDFGYNGSYSIFSLCLEKHRLQENNNLDLSSISYFRGSIKDKLIFILKNYQNKFDRHELISLLWPDEEYDLKHDKRLNSLISKIRKEKGLEIIKDKGRYKLCA